MMEWLEMGAEHKVEKAKQLLDEMTRNFPASAAKYEASK